jgi:hypothetical protein
VTSSYATLAGQPVTRATIVVPASGAWWADVDFELAPDVSGRVSLEVGGITLSGTVDPTRAGTYGQRRTVRIVAGAGAWASMLAARHYHNDLGVRASLVLEDAAREVGESIVVDADVGTRSLGVDFVREAGPASRALRAAMGSALWWVELDGTTRVATARAESDARTGSYEVLAHDPRKRMVTLAADDLSAIGIGSRLVDRLDEAQTVRELTVHVAEGGVRLVARCGEQAAQSQLTRAISGLMRQVASERLFGRWRYRVVRISVDRLELQPVRRDAGLPEMLPISMWPGVAGAHAKPQLGAEVLVEFIEGDRTQPIVTGFAGKDGIGHAPDELTLSVGTVLRLGGSAASDAVALAPDVNSRLNDLTTAINAYIGATPVPNDGGAALQTAVKTLGGWGTPKTSVDVAASKVVAQ